MLHYDDVWRKMYGYQPKWGSEKILLMVDIGNSETINEYTYPYR